MKKNKRIDLTFCINILRTKYSFIKRKYYIKSMHIFGSVARGDNNFNSDVDILVAFTKTPSFFKLINMQNYISDILQVKVDLVIEDALKPSMIKRVIKEKVKI